MENREIPHLVALQKWKNTITCQRFNQGAWHVVNPVSPVVGEVENHTQKARRSFFFTLGNTGLFKAS